MKIREAIKRDIPRLINLIRIADNRTKNWARKKIKEYLERNDRIILLLIDKTKIIGYVFGEEKDDDERISNKLDINQFSAIAHIAIHPDYRNKGIGSKLLKAYEKYSKRWKKKGIVLDCMKDKTPFYKKNNYRNVGYFIKKENVKKPRRQYVMVKKVK